LPDEKQSVMKQRKRKAPLDSTEAENKEWMRHPKADQLTHEARQAGDVTGLVAVWDPEKRLTRFVRPEKLLIELAVQADGK
jgi:hypothetical protein